MQENRQQLSFSLPPVTPYSLDYFVPHTGVAAALDRLLKEFQLLRDYFALNDDRLQKPRKGKLIFIQGPEGSGKTHLLTGFESLARNAGMGAEIVRVYDLNFESKPENRAAQLHLLPHASPEVGEFVSNYEKVKVDGGLIVLSSRESPLHTTDNPHLRSRFATAETMVIGYPKEDELRPLIQSMCERFNLKPTEGALKFLLKRIPLDPLSFSNILARINEVSFESGKPIKLPLVKAVLSE